MIVSTEKVRLTSSKDASDHIMKALEKMDQIDIGKEHFWVIHLNGRNVITSVDLVAAGCATSSLDIVLNRFTEIFLAFPVIYLIVLILALFGSSLLSVIVVLGISGWMSLFKIVKSEVLSIKQKDFFSTAELVGLNKSQLLIKEILPVIVAPVLVNLVFLFSNVVLAEAALSYLGLGSGNAYPSWGSMISSGQEYITKAWWLIAFPGLGLILTLFSVNSSGKMLGKVLNPRLKQ